MNYFLHTGHLNIDGLKMSKSLKNFITIRQTLQQFTPNQIRICFLLHKWNTTLNYSDGAMEEQLIEHIALKEAIARLPEREKTVIALRYYRGLTQDKTAKILGVSQVQVSRIEKKALQALRTYF